MKELSWSYSMYSSALNCLACFHKQYILGEKPVGPESADLAFGTCMHSAANSYWNGEDGEAVFTLFWDTLDPSTMEYSRFKHHELRALGLKFCRILKNKYVPRMQMSKGEVRLHGMNYECKLNGQLDFYGTLDGKLTLLDLKTSAYNYPAEKKLTALQLNLYAYLALENGYEPPEQLGYLVLSKGGGSVQAPLVWKFDPDECLRMVNEMVMYCRMFQTMQMYPRNPNCPRHAFRCYEEAA